MKLQLKYLCFFLFLILAGNLTAQNVSISGKVVNEDGEPLSGVAIKVRGVDGSFRTNDAGKFSIPVPPNDVYNFRFTYLKQPVKKEIAVQYTDVTGLVIRFQKNLLDEIQVVELRASDFMDGMPKVELNRISTPSRNFEDFIKVVGLGVNSNNELSSNYNVRGGNYDENLIYVNGIQIYRPFLARSGQQEGLSFINPAFVNNIFFSAGGFDSYYGDRLSSVLDIRYRQPRKFGGSAQASLMGVEAHVEGTFAGRRGSYITGARYRANSYLLNSLPTQGDYNPTFFDYQFLVNFYNDYDGPGTV